MKRHDDRLKNNEKNTQPFHAAMREKLTYRNLWEMNQPSEVLRICDSRLLYLCTLEEGSA